MVDLVRAVVEGLERLGVEQGYQKIKAGIVIRDNGIQGAFLLAQGVEIHVVVVGDGLDLGQVEGGQPDGGGHEDGLGGLARGHLKDLVLPHRYAVRSILFYGLEEQVQGRDVLFVLLLHLGVFQYPHDHGEILFILRGLLEQHEDDGLEERRLGLGPEWVGLMTAFRGGGLDEIVHQLESVLLVPQIAEGVVAVALLQVDQIEHPDLVPVLLQPAASGGEHLLLRVSDHIVGIGLQDVGFHVAPGLGRAAAADNQHIQGSAVLVGIQPQADIAGQDLVLLLGEHGVDLPGRGPGGGAVLRPLTPAAVLRAPQGEGRDIDAGATQDGEETLVRPPHLQGILERGGQAGDQGRQSASRALAAFQ